MYAYKTNSADYLDYVASVKSRKEIMADPDLCLLLENPYIKDNMQMAILYNQAKYGDYQDKYNFMEYFMCNGPQLDADTILHYRMKAYNDPIMLEIAYSYLNDTNQLAELRENKYGKETDNCFKNPCFYMGKFSAMMGNIGDSSNTKSAFNIAGRAARAAYGKLKNAADNIAKARIGLGELKEQTKNLFKDGYLLLERAVENTVDYLSSSDDSPTGADDVADPTGGEVPKTDNDDQPAPAPPIRDCFKGSIIPAMYKGCSQIMGQIFQGNETFTKELAECVNTTSNAENIGDAMCGPISEMLELVTKANVKRQMGDCARLWSQVRRLRLFSSDNKYAPIVASQKVDGVNTDGTPTNVVADPQPTAERASRNIAAHAAAANGTPPKQTQTREDTQENMDKVMEEQLPDTPTITDPSASDDVFGRNLQASRDAQALTTWNQTTAADQISIYGESAWKAANAQVQQQNIRDNTITLNSNFTPDFGYNPNGR